MGACFVLAMVCNACFVPTRLVGHDSWVLFGLYMTAQIGIMLLNAAFKLSGTYAIGFWCLLSQTNKTY